MRRIACKPLWVAAQLSLLLYACKSGDDDSGQDAPPSTNNPSDMPEAGSGSGDANGAGHAGGGSTDMSSAGKGGSSNPTGGSEAGSGSPDPGGAGTAGSDEPPDMPPDPSALPMTPLSDLPEVFASAICGALRDCLGDSKLRELTRRENCSTAIEAELRAKDFAHMDAAVSAGHVLYDPASLSDCVDGIRALSCDVLTHTFPQACVDVLDGNVEIGGECTITAECEGAAYCAGTLTCPSKCAALLNEGDSCDGDGECSDGLSCSGGKCRAASQAGEDCGGTSGKGCALGLNCKGATDTQIGSCVSNAEIQVGDEGDACEPGGALCKDGLSCVFAGNSMFHCEAAVAAGGKCHLGLPGQCPNSQYCDATEVTAESTCRDLPGVDQPCVLNGLCKGGLVCVDDGGPVCRPIADNGTDCIADAQCRSGRCISDKCAPPPSCH
jgi:hypothetical protein